MNINQLSEFCYGEIASQYGFIRNQSGYYRVGDRVVTSFALRKFAGGRMVEPIMDILPLCGEIHIGSSITMMNQIAADYSRHTEKAGRVWFNSRSSKEECIAAKECFLDVFHETQKPFLIQSIDLQSAFDAYCAYLLYQEYRPKEWLESGFKMLKFNYIADINYWMFLLALKQYDKALDNFNEWSKALDKDLLDETHECGKMQRLLVKEEYDAIETIIKEREQENTELLKKYGVWCQD